MKNRINYRRDKRLQRVERKCDRILAELLVIRQSLTRKSTDIDAVIEKMHAQAKRMREYSEAERDVVRAMMRKNDSL